MAKLENEPTVASVWPNSQSFADRARKAVPDDLLRSIVADGTRTHYPQDRVAHTPTPTPETPPTFVEWCRQRLGVEWSYERAKHYYQTQRSAGRDVGPAIDERAPGTTVRGWAEPLPLRNGFNPVIEQMLDHQAAADLAERKRRGRL